MRLRNQFLLTLLGASLAILAAMVVLIQFSFERSLEQYLSQRQQALLAGLSQEFADYYSYYGSFDGITLRTLLWNMEAGQERRIPPDLALLDSNHDLIFGPPVPPESLRLHPVTTDQGVVGWVGLPDSPEFREGRARRFEKRQQRLLLSVAVFALLLAAVGAFWLSRRLIRPIEAVAQLSGQLRDGNYHARLESHRRDELGQLINAMNVLADTLATTQQARQRWLADMAHELRTPMTVLRAEIEALQDGVRPLGAEALTRLHQQVLHLSHLLNDLHDLSLADAGALRYQMQTLDLRQLCQQAAATEQDRHHLTLRLPDSPCLIQGDAVRLRQLLDNLLSNSHKYTDAGGTIALSLQCQDGKVRLRLEDSAPGVRDDQLPHLFEYLYRAEASRNRQTGGAGLGLAICERIVDAHQGSIRASHSSLGGLCIEIELPESQP